MLWPVGGMAATWALGSAALGPDSLAPLAAAGAAGALGIAYVRWLQPRSRIEVIGGSLWPWEAFCWERRARRELGHVVELWPWIAERSGIPRAVVTHAIADPIEGYSLHVRLARGQVGTDIKLPRLATALREFR